MNAGNDPAARHGSGRGSARGSAWYRQPIVWLGAFVFVASIAGCVWLIVVGTRYADTPLDTVETSVAALRPTAVVLATIDADRFHQHTDAIRRLAVSTTVAVAAPVEAQDIEQLGAQALVAGIAESADRLAEDAARPAPGRPSRRARSSAAR